MLDIPLRERRKDYMTDQGRLARARRPFVQVEFTDQVQGYFRRAVMVDTCAPFSVLPYSLWHDKNLWWQPLGSQLQTLTGQPDPEALKWCGVPCLLAETQAVLVDEAGQRSRFCRMVAKFLTTLLPRQLESSIILGYNFLFDNSITMKLHPASPITVGSFSNVVGFLTVP